MSAVWAWIGPEVGLSKNDLIAIVDDDKAVRESIKRLIRSFGFSVETFPTAAAFLASPSLDRTRCLITDINMPGMTGVELFRYLIEGDRAIPTIIITAYPNDAVQVQVLSDGAVCYLTKPFDEAALLLCVGEALDRRGSFGSDQ